jgi:glycosyltransferase involved in cell wall biosynthesis
MSSPFPPLFLDVTQCALKGGRSGIPRMCRELCQALAGEGAEVHPLVWEDPLGAFACPTAFHCRNLDPVPARRPVRRTRAMVPFWQRWWRVWTRGLRRRDPEEMNGGWVVFAETFADGRIEWLERFGRGQAPFRCAAVFYDAIALTNPEWIPAQNRKRFEAYAASLAACDLVFCISRQSEGDLRDFWAARGLPPAPTRVMLLPATDLVRLAERGAPLPPASRPMILYVATLEPRKNHLALLRVCEQLWSRGLDFELVLVGQRLRQGSEEIVAGMDRLVAAGRPLDWQREIDDFSLAGLYRRCAFTVYPSLKEGFGLPILESLGYGKACVCHQAGAIAEAAAGGGCLQIDVADEAALGAAIERLLSPSGRERYEREAAARSFATWRGYARELLAALG